MVISLAVAPPLKREASSLPICTCRLSAAESFFSRSGAEAIYIDEQGNSDHQEQKDTDDDPGDEQANASW